jgi:hypothetical protein
MLTVKAVSTAHGERRYDSVLFFESLYIRPDLRNFSCKFVAHGEPRARRLVAPEDVELTKIMLAMSIS